MTLFHKVRTTCRQVIEHAKHVELDFSNIDVYRDMLLEHASDRLVHSADHHYLNRGVDTLSFFLVLDTVNFGSGYFPHIKKTNKTSGYFTIAKYLKEWFVAEGVPTPQSLLDLSLERCGEIFGQDTSSPAPSRELMAHFRNALGDLGTLLLERYNGSYADFFASAGSAEALVKRALQMPMFNDVHQYEGQPVYFLKRAQILVQDVCVAEPGHDFTKFEDVNQLTAFADNIIPYVLRCDGILRLAPDLAARIEGEQDIESGCPEEIELRAAGVVAVEHIVRYLRESCGEDVCDRNIDFMMWGRGQRFKEAFSFKRHRTRCVYY